MGCWRLRGVGGSALERELAAMLGHWRQQVGIGTSLRRAADMLAHAVRLGARVMVEGGQRCLLCTAHVAGGAGQSWGGAAALALLAVLGLLSSAMVGCWG
jgi:hypothetical protein